MGTLNDLLVRLHLLLVPPPGQRERGDVPGWVMITMMSAGIVVALTAVARPQLTEILQSALNKVNK